MVIEVCLQCSNARERRRAAYVFQTMFSTLGLPWRLAEHPLREKAESDVAPAGLPALVVHYGDQLADELRDRLATGGGIHVVRASEREKRALCPDGDRLGGVTVEETPVGSLIESDMITATLRCLSGIEGETGRLREKSRPGSTRDGKSGKDLAQTPWVNRYLDLLLDTIGQGCARIGIPLIQKWYWPGCKPFAASLSHDVDRTRRREPFLLASNALRSLRFLSRLRVGQAGRRLTEIGQLLVGHEDPLANFWRWLDLERKHGFRSTFFFLGGPRWRRYGARYDLKAPETRQIIDMIAAQGWEVGLHGSYYASCDRRCLEREKRELEAIVAAPVRGHRQHYLHLRVPDSWSAQEAAGLVYDASYGYRFKAGFRAGMCFPFFPYNVEAERCSRVLELPLIFMDSNYRSVLGKQGWQLICPLLETVQRHHGLITFNFHYCGIHERSYPGWFELYARLLDCLREQDAFVAPGAEIARWWDQRNHLQFVDEKRTPEGTTWTLRAGKRICDVCLRVCGCDVRRGARVTGLVDYHTSTEGQTMWIGIDELAPDTTVEIQVMYTPQNRSLSEQGAAR